MNPLQLRNFDLNLLVVFAEIMKERSISGAAERLSLSQSAVSHALRRLRKLLHDEVFIRDVVGMRPTARALELALPVQRALDGIEIALTSQEFAPERSARTFTIAASDYSCMLLIPRLLGRLALTAPEVDLCVVPTSRLDVILQLDEGRIDLAIAWFAAVPERFGRAKLVDENYVFVVRAGHPLTSGKLTATRALSYPHVVVDYVGKVDNLVDGFLPEHGVMRRVHMDRAVLEAPQRLQRQGRVAVKVPNFCNVPPIVACTDTIASIPRRLAADMGSTYKLVVMEPPFDMTPVAVEVIWHRRMETDPAVTWLREQVKLAAIELD